MTASEFDDVLAANRDYAGSFALGGMEPRAARGLAVVTCMDSRIEPLQMLGLQPGDAKILRNAGARVNQDVIRSLVLGVHLLGVRRVLVVPHTKCGTLGSQDEVVATVREAGGPDVSALDLATTTDQQATLRADLDLLRSSPYLAGTVIGGAVYDVETGLLTPVD